MNIHIESFGCTRRKLDVAKFYKYFALNGYTIVQKPRKADYILVTTCAFKKEEEERSLDAIESFRKYDAKIIVYGCLPDISPSKYHSRCNYIYISPKKVDEIDKYFGNITYKFAEIDEANLINNEIEYSSFPKAFRKFTSKFEPSVEFFVKSCRYVMNKYLTKKQIYYLSTGRGCLGNCSYCAIRYATGTIKSKTIDIVIKEFIKGIEAGYQDFIVLGDDVGAYGQDIGSNISELLAAFLSVIEKQNGTTSGSGIGLHIEEINPRWIIKYEKELESLLASNNIKSILCPVQSGNNRILGLMNRGYDVERLLFILKEIRKSNPEIRLSTQIIAGFPSETENDFEDTLTMLSKLPFDNVVLFPYDDKENTKAHDIQPKVPEDVIQERIKKAQVFLKQKKIKAALSCNEI